MTWSAPRERTMSTFVVLHTAATSAPNALASCTAKVATPPEAPMINTFWPGSTCPWSRPLQGGQAGDGDHGRLFEGEVRRPGRQLVLAGAGVLGEGALADAEHLIAGLELSHVVADRLHDPGHIHAWNGGVGRPQPAVHEAYRVRNGSHG
jgi:hypothetical protein